MSKIIILTHRGLEPEKKEAYPESSYEAFEEQLKRGYGIEFDANFSKDDVVVCHDMTLERVTGGADKRRIAEISTTELRGIRFGNPAGRIPTLKEVMALIKESPARLHAFHLRGQFQNEAHLKRLTIILSKYQEVLSRLLIFDVKPEAAKYLKERLEINLAPSVAHPYDRERYNDRVHGTLLTVEEAIRNKELYEWVWLDEWDLSDSKGTKQLYTAKTFARFREVGFRIGLVTPELHGTSPGLLGGESHPDAAHNRLFERISRIISLHPDALCTDYPEEAARLVNSE